jgi:hypothetical protein
MPLLTQAQLITAFADNTSGLITALDMRDFVNAVEVDALQAFLALTTTSGTNLTLNPTLLTINGNVTIPNPSTLTIQNLVAGTLTIQNLVAGGVVQLGDGAWLENGNPLSLGNACVIRWNTVADPNTSNTPDITLTRTAASTLTLGNGSSGYATLVAGIATFNGLVSANANIATPEINPAGGTLAVGGGMVMHGSISMSGNPINLNNGNIASVSQVAYSTNALTDAATITWNMNLGSFASVTLAGSRTLAFPTNVNAGANYTLTVKQDATGGRMLIYAANYKWPGGVPFALSTAPNAIDVITFVSDGTYMFGTGINNFQ